MNWQSLLSPEIQNFINVHQNEDVAALALKKTPDPCWDYKLVLDQIKARQKAKTKAPSWLRKKNPIIFPSAALVEQASSEATALYKASLFRGASFVDITGGMGMDSWALAHKFQNGSVIEMTPPSAELLEHNFKALGLNHIKILNTKAEKYINHMGSIDLVMIDPQRRDDHRSGKFMLQECSPNILDLWPILKDKASAVLLKTSPMLDITATIAALRDIKSVHILEVQDECKEVLYVLSKNHTDPACIHAVSLNHQGKILYHLDFTFASEADTQITYSLPQTYLYEPSAAFQKAGCFKTIAAKFKVEKLHPCTHLYTSQFLVSDFPGRIFKIEGLYSADGKNITLSQANITLRNFPGSAESLRKKLKLKDGGENTLFACTLIEGQKILIHGRKA